MPNLNKVMLMGNLTRDPEMRYTASNTPVAKLGLATNRRWRDRQGELKEEACFVDCTAFGRTAEVLSQYLQKGRPLFIEGRLSLDRWQDQQGNNRSKLEVIIESFEFIDNRGGDGGGGGGGFQNRGPAAAPRGGGYSPGNAPPPTTGAGAGAGAGAERAAGAYGPSEAGPGHQPTEDDDIPF